MALSLPAGKFVTFIQDVPDFANYFYSLSNQQEAYIVATAIADLSPKRNSDWRDGLLERVQQARTMSLGIDTPLNSLKEIPDGWNWHLSTPNVPGVPVGTVVEPSTDKLPKRSGFLLPYRFIALPEGTIKAPKWIEEENIQAASEYENPPTDLQQLGILEDDHLHDEARYPTLKGRGPKREALAVCEMIALNQQVPFRKDSIQKVLEGQFRRDKGLSLELIGGLCEL